MCSYTSSESTSARVGRRSSASTSRSAALAIRRGRIVRRVEHHQPRARVTATARTRSQSIWKCGGSSGMWIGRPPASNHRRRIRIVRRIEQDHFVAGMHERTAPRRRCASVAPSVMVISFSAVEQPAVARAELERDLLAQLGDADHRRVLVVSGRDVIRDQVLQLRRRVVVGKSLRQIDRAELAGAIGHDREDGRADVRQFRTDVH